MRANCLRRLLRGLAEHPAMQLSNERL